MIVIVVTVMIRVTVLPCTESMIEYVVVMLLLLLLLLLLLRLLCFMMLSFCEYIREREAVGEFGLTTIEAARKQNKVQVTSGFYSLPCVKYAATTTYFKYLGGKELN